MAESFRTTEDAESAVCWGAIFAGAFSAAAVTPHSHYIGNRNRISYCFSVVGQWFVRRRIQD